MNPISNIIYCTSGHKFFPLPQLRFGL